MFLFSGLSAQKEPEFSFVQDTMTLTGTNRVLEGEYLEVALSDLHVVRLFKTRDHKIYLRFMVTSNFYFDKVGTLEILSGSKTYSAKEIRQFMVTKNSGLFVTEIFSNYLTTIRNEGITELVFNQATTRFSRNDTRKIKKMAEYFQNVYLSETKKRSDI
jgi:hypothetical protein